jgi:hypothetical protein
MPWPVIPLTPPPTFDHQVGTICVACVLLSFWSRDVHCYPRRRGRHRGQGVVSAGPGVEPSITPSLLHVPPARHLTCTHPPHPPTHPPTAQGQHQQLTPNLSSLNRVLRALPLLASTPLRLPTYCPATPIRGHGTRPERWSVHGCWHTLALQVQQLGRMPRFQGSVTLPAAVDALIDLGIVSKVCCRTSMP